MAKEDDLKKLIDEVTRLQEEVKKAPTVGAQKASIDAMNEALKEANEYYKENKNAIVDTNGELKKQLGEVDKLGKSLSNLLLVNKGIRSSFKEMTEDTIKFSRSTDMWFRKGEELATQYLKVSKNIGLTENRSRTLTTNFNNSVRESLALGYSLDDLRDTFQGFAEETGRARILSSDEAENIAKVAQGANLYGTEATKMAEQFDLMGISSEKMVNLLNESIRTSREMGLNSNKVIKVLQQNMGAMQQYSFSKGVKGMIEMSKLSVKMRMNISEMLLMADKFYHPEAAIEAAANLQMLGGDIAKAFGDPFEVMYLARNKPEELAKRVGMMTENMVSFNEETGEFDFPPEARMQLQAVSKELGIGMDSLTEMTRQASKIKSIKMNVSGNVLDENLREGIAGMARIKDGKWVVDFEDGGKTITESIDNLSEEQAKLVLDQQKEFSDKTEKDFLKEIALNTQTFTEKQKTIKDSQEYGFAAETDIYSLTMDSFLKDSLETYRRESQNMFSALSKSFGDGDGLRNVLRESFGVKTGGESIIEQEFRLIFANMTNAINKSSEMGKLDITKLNANATDVEIFTDGFKSANDIKINSGDGTYVMGPKGSFKLNKQDEYYGKDGTFTAGTNLGADKPIKTMDNNISNGSISVGGTANININIKSDNPSLDISSLKSEISSVVTKMFNNGGMPDGANLPQGSKGYIQTM
jgi:hypothetical protein